MYKQKRKTWFFVADGTKARIFESQSRKDPWMLLDELSNEEARAPSFELGDARPGRGQSSGLGGRYAVDDSSLHDKEEEKFIRECATYLNTSGFEEAYDQLVLTAPPRALGMLRKSLTPNATSKYIAVLDKDLTNLPDQELYSYFKEHIERW